MRERTTRTVERVDGPVEYEESAPVYGTHNERWPWAVRGIGRMLSLWVLLAIAIVETALSFRLGFFLADANRTGFVDFIYDITGPLVGPFQGIAAVRDVENAGMFEPATVIAMIVYLVAALLLIAVINLLTSTPASIAEDGEAAHHRRYPLVRH
jgi:hypothetical protein